MSSEGRLVENSAVQQDTVPSANLSANYDTSLANGLARLSIQSHTSAEDLSTSQLTTSDMSASSSQSPDSWISSFCSLMGHEYFAEVSEDFIEDDFNLTGLQSQVPMYKDALEMILDVEPSDTGSSALSEEDDEEEDDDGLLGDDSKPLYDRRTNEGKRHMRMPSDTAIIESSAELLYGLVHARYITSRPGIQQMMEKYEHAHFGYCPRVFCNGCKVLPVGRTDTPGQETVKLFCPSCLDIYTPPNSRFQSVDGAFFGTTFGCLFFMTFPDLEFSTTTPSSSASRAQIAQSVVTADNPLSPSMTSSTLESGKSRSSTANTNGGASPRTNSSSTPIEPKSIPLQPTTINGILTSNLAPGLGKPRIYEPRIYGFRVSERAKSGPRMKWLRMKPEDINELDECTKWHEQWGGDPDGDPVIGNGDEMEEEDEEGDGEYYGGGEEAGDEGGDEGGGTGDIEELGREGGNVGIGEVKAGKKGKKGRRKVETSGLVDGVAVG